MSTVEVHPEPIEGPWIEGFVLDRHVVSSYPIGHVGEHMQFETTRSALGELFYQLKYKSGPATDIVETAVAFIQERWTGMVDVVIAPPPSLHRASQPTSAILDGLAIGLGVVALSAALAKSTATPQMKNVTLAERGPLLQAAIQAGTQTVDGLRVLIVDDLWETGSTMRRSAEVLRAAGALEIRALALTRTR